MPIDFYYLGGSAPCRSVHLLCKALGIEFNLMPVDLMQREQLKPEFIAINFQHTIPTIVDNGFTLWESRAILGYLANKYGKNDSLYPKDPQKRALVDQLLYFDIGTLYKAFADYVYPQFLYKQPADPEKEQAVKVALGHFENFLKKNKYVAGDNMTIADFSLLATTSTVEATNIDISEFGRVNEWLEQMKKLPYYAKANGEGVEIFRKMLLSATSK